MITADVINSIYKQYNKRPNKIEDLDLALLFEKAGIDHDILIDPETQTMTIGSIVEDSPFHSLNLKNIYGIVPFEQWTAIVLHSSIIFLHNARPQVSIHLKQPSMSIWDKIKNTVHA